MHVCVPNTLGDAQSQAASFGVDPRRTVVSSRTPYSIECRGLTLRPLRMVLGLGNLSR